MSTYLRFQSRLPCQRTQRPMGIFAAAGVVEELPELDVNIRDRLAESLTWFNRNLKVPPLSSNGWRCLFWFRSDARQFINRIWDLTTILNETGVYVKKLWTTDPGMIVYSDRYQIGAVPHSRRRRNRPRIGAS